MGTVAAQLKHFHNGYIGVWIDFYPTLAAKNKSAARMGHPYFHYTISENALKVVP
jgi:hypothetical protein